MVVLYIVARRVPCVKRESTGRVVNWKRRGGWLDLNVWKSLDGLGIDRFGKGLPLMTHGPDQILRNMMKV